MNAERRGNGESEIDIKTVPLDDPQTFEFLKTAETTAVFQLESEGMKDLIRRLLPDSIDDIIALVALYRPGPLQSRRRRRLREPQARQGAGGLPPSGAGECPQKHLWRDALSGASDEHGPIAGRFFTGRGGSPAARHGQEKPEEMVEMRTMFLAGTDAHNVDQRIANDVFDQAEKFAGYAFNKAHAAAYALLSFQTAWLKAHYPAQFMAAVLSADMQTIEKVVSLIDEVKRMKLKLHPPT